MTRFALFSILLILVLSCQKKNKSNINRDDIETISFYEVYSEKLPFSFFVDTMELIPLETNDENMIGEITRLIFYDDKYYVRATNGMQNGQLFVFDKTGNYLRKIGEKGGGPGEYLEFKDFTITHDGKIVLADYQRLLIYDSKGEFLYSTKVDRSFFANEILPIGENEILAFHSLPGLLNNNMLSKISKEGVNKLFFNRGQIEALKCSFLTTWRSFVLADSSYYLKYPFCDTIFSISKDKDLNEITATYSIDYGKKKRPDIKVDLDDNVLTWEKKLNQLDDYLETASIGIGEDFLYLGTTDKRHKGYITLYSFHSKRSVSTQKLIDDLYLKGNIIPITAKCIPHNMDGNDILWEMDPSILLKGYRQYWSNLSEPKRETFKLNYPEWYRICNSLKEDDNPVLLRIKVKRF